MKILYTFYHGAAFAWALVHRLSVHPEDEAYLLVADGWDWCAGKPKLLLLLLRFAKLGVFREVYTYDNRLGRDGMKFDTPKKSEAAIFDGMEKRLRHQKCDIAGFDRIYSNTDGEDTLGIYLSMKQIKYFWFENSPGLLALRTQRWVRETYASHPGYRDALIRHKTLFGGSALQSYILYPDSDRADFAEERCQVFDAEAAAAGLPEADKKRILECFELMGAACPPDAALLLLQSNWLPGLVYDSCEFVRRRYGHHWFYMYSAIQCMLDYFMPEGAVPVLKTHPTVLIDGKTSAKYFGGAFAFHALFTVLLTKTLLPDFIPKYRILLGSSSNRQLKGVQNDICCPGVWLFPLFYHKFYTVLSVLDRLGGIYRNAGERFETVGSAGNVMNYNGNYMKTDINSLIRLHFPDAPEEQKLSYTVVQTEAQELEEKLARYDFVILTDVWQTMTPEQADALTPNVYITTIRLRKQPVKDRADILAPLEEERIYLVSKSERWGKQLEGCRLTKQNRYAGFVMTAEAFCGREAVPKEKKPPFAVNTPINLQECYQSFGRHYEDDRGDEIEIGGEITARALENMGAITVKFSGAGKNRVIFRSLDTPNRISGNFRVEALNGCVIEIGRLMFANHGVLIHSSNARVRIYDDTLLESGTVVRAMNYHSVYELDGRRLPNRDLTIGKHVWIGYGVTVYAGADIASGSVIDSGSVIMGKIPNNCFAAGNPACAVRNDIFWQFNGCSTDYYSLPGQQQTADKYIAKTQEE